MKLLNKLISVVLSAATILLMMAGMPLRKAHIGPVAGQAVNVFVAGLTCYGELNAVHNIFPLWGMSKGDVGKALEELGYESYTASTGPFSSVWDRSCELYAQLTGGTVDYGAAHAKEHGHHRYGRSYEKPLFTGWSEQRPINLLGHSFGGPTVRLFAELCVNGDAAERAATPAEELSPLFRGGMHRRIKSVTVLASTNNGSTVDVAMQEGQDLKNYLPVIGLLSRVGTTPYLNGFYDLQLEQWELSNPTGQFRGYEFDAEKVASFLRSRDNALIDLSIEGAERVNERTKNLHPDIYYFSYANSLSKPISFSQTGRQFIPIENIGNPIYYYFGMQIGLGLGKVQVYTTLEDGRQALDPAWLQNDGNVNLASALYPFGQPYKIFDESSVPSGTWNVMPVLYNTGHGYYVGFDTVHGTFEELLDFYVGHMELLDQLD
ncbi:MAG: hypothetical protein FWH26_03355 [Oscillospiraceae bacterium]|nr:hypothetical protein [Oscillospiraceae bacterium]